MNENSVSFSHRTDILSDPLLSKILRYLDLRNKSRVTSVSKQFSRCSDSIISKTSSITIFSGYTKKPVVFALNKYLNVCPFTLKDSRQLSDDLHQIGYDFEDIRHKYETLFQKLTNLKKITFVLYSVSEQIIQWLAQIFRPNVSIKLIQIIHEHVGEYHWQQNEINSLQRHFAQRITSLRITTNLVSKLDLSRFQSLKTLIVGSKDSIECGSVRKWPQSLKLIAINELEVSKLFMDCLCQSRVHKNLSKLHIRCENGFRNCDIFEMIGHSFTYLQTLNISINSLVSIESLFHLNRLRICRNLTIEFRHKTNICLHPLNDNSKVLDKLKTLKLKGNYRLKNIQEMIEIFTNLKQLFLCDFQIECKSSETEYVCFECIYNQIKDLVVVAHFAKLKTLSIQFWKDIDFSLHYRMIIRVIFEIINDFEQYFRLNLTKKENEMKINCFIDLILFSSLVPNRRINYFVPSKDFNEVIKYVNIFPENANIMKASKYSEQGQFRDNADLAVIWKERTKYSFFEMLFQKSANLSTKFIL